MTRHTRSFGSMTRTTAKAPLLAMSLAALFARPGANAQTNTPTPSLSEQPSCRAVALSIDTKETKKSDIDPLRTVLTDFETSFFLGNSELFSNIVSPALLKKKEDAKKIFDGTVLEFDLQRAKLQRNWIWELKVGQAPEPGRMIQCGDLRIQPVYGPLHQYAVQYSVFDGSKQTRLFALFAMTLSEQGSDKPGLVHLQVQRWTYDGRSPDQILTQARQLTSAGDTLAGALLAEASARIMEINPYIQSPQLTVARESANQFAKNVENAQAKLLASIQTSSQMRGEKFVPVFRDGSLALGLKVRMQIDMALNDQTKHCIEAGKKLIKENQNWKSYFAGLECMAYKNTEDVNKPPRGGSQFFTWSALDSK